MEPGHAASFAVKPWVSRQTVVTANNGRTFSAWILYTEQRRLLKPAPGYPPMQAPQD